MGAERRLFRDPSSVSIPRPLNADRGAGAFPVFVHFPQRPVSSPSLRDAEPFLGTRAGGAVDSSSR